MLSKRRSPKRSVPTQGPRPMLMTQGEIRDAVARGEIAAITLDTSVFDRHQLRLEDALLDRLRQFRGTGVSVVFTDVVLLELNAHIQRDVEKTRKALDDALRALSRSHSIPQEQIGAAIEKLPTQATPAELTKTRIDAFLQATGGEEINSSAHASIDKLIRGYFDEKAPFGPGKKKHEFPDAISLHALEGWAAEHGRKMLVVSGDDGWLKYCEESATLVGVRDLGDALSFFQQHAARFAVVEISESLEGPALDGFQGAVHSAIESDIENIRISEEADSWLAFDIYGIDSRLLSIEFSGRKGEPELEVVEVNDGGVVARVAVEATLEVTGSFSFSRWDREDGTMLPMGFAYRSIVVDQSLDVLVTFTRERGDLEAKKIELLPTEIHVDFGEIEPDWSGDDDPR